MPCPPQDTVSLSGRDQCPASRSIDSTTQSAAIPRNLRSCRQSQTSRNNLPAYCTWISTWRTGMIAGCEEQRLILCQTSLGICLGVRWRWILGEDYGIAPMISYLTCFTDAFSVHEFGWKYMKTITLGLVFFLQFTIFKGVANSS